MDKGFEANQGRRRFLSLTLMTATIAALPFGKVRAGGGGYAGATEPTQIMNNIQLAIQTVEEEMQRVQMTMNTYYAMLQQMPNAVMGQLGIGDLGNTISQMRGMAGSLTRLFGNLQNMRGLATSRLQNFAASGLSWENYARRESESVQDRVDRYGFLNGMEREAIQSVEEGFSTVQEYQRKIGTSMGTHESTQLMNAQMNTLLTMTNKMFGSMVAHQNVDTANRQEDLIIKDRGNKTLIKAYETLNSSMKGAYDALRGFGR